MSDEEEKRAIFAMAATMSGMTEEEMAEHIRAYLIDNPDAMSAEDAATVLANIDKAMTRH